MVADNALHNLASWALHLNTSPSFSSSIHIDLLNLSQTIRHVSTSGTLHQLFSLPQNFTPDICIFTSLLKYYLLSEGCPEYSIWTCHTLRYFQYLLPCSVYFLYHTYHLAKNYINYFYIMFLAFLLPQSQKSFFHLFSYVFPETRIIPGIL